MYSLSALSGSCDADLMITRQFGCLSAFCPVRPTPAKICAPNALTLRRWRLVQQRMLVQTIAVQLIKFNFYWQCLFSFELLPLAAAGTNAATTSFSAICIVAKKPLGSSWFSLWLPLCRIRKTKNSLAGGIARLDAASSPELVGLWLVGGSQPRLGLVAANRVGLNADRSKNYYTTPWRRRASDARYPFHSYSLVCSPCLFACAHLKSSKVVKSFNRLRLSKTYTLMLLVKLRSCLLICAGRCSPTLLWVALFSRGSSWSASSPGLVGRSRGCCLALTFSGRRQSRLNWVAASLWLGCLLWGSCLFA